MAFSTSGGETGRRHVRKRSALLSLLVVGIWCVRPATALAVVGSWQSGGVEGVLGVVEDYWEQFATGGWRASTWHCSGGVARPGTKPKGEQNGWCRHRSEPDAVARCVLLDAKPPAAMRPTETAPKTVTPTRDSSLTGGLSRPPTSPVRPDPVRSHHLDQRGNPRESTPSRHRQQTLHLAAGDGNVSCGF